jgi:hypothetical protein
VSFVQVKTTDGKFVTIHSSALPSGHQMSMVDSTGDERTINNTMRHQYRVLTEPEKKAMSALKDTGITLIRQIELCVPKGRERDIAMTRVEEAVMWAVKGLTA